jgi:hypothetical protein
MTVALIICGILLLVAVACDLLLNVIRYNSLRIRFEKLVKQCDGLIDRMNENTEDVASDINDLYGRVSKLERRKF